MKYFILFLTVFIIHTTCNSQFHYKFKSASDSTKITVNGEFVGYAPLEYKFFWKRKTEKIDIIASEDGYISWEKEILRKPTVFNLEEHISLKKILPRFDLDSVTTVIAFDKLIVNFNTGKKVGEIKRLDKDVEDINWEGSAKIGEDSFQEKFYDLALNAGFKTPFSEDLKLFSNGKPQLPRFIIGVEITECFIELEENSTDFFGNIKYKGKTRLDFEWKILDQANSKVVSIFNNQGVSYYKTSSRNADLNNYSAFENALIDFFFKSDIESIVRSAENVSYPVVEDSTKYEVEALTNPSFSKLSEMIKFTNKACVTIITDGGHGSGVVINEEGYVLSAYHVVEGVNSIEIQFSNGLKQEAVILHYDILNDIVLLDLVGSGYQALPINSEDIVSIGDEVITIGTPANLALGQSVAKGIISGKREIEDLIFLQTDMAVSPGNSGGPLLNEKGEIIGIIQRKIIDDGVEGIGFALPIDVAIKKLNLEIIQK